MRIATDEELKWELFLRNRESGQLIWRDKSGREQSLKDLDTNHIENILNSRKKYLDESTKIKSSSLNFY
jgi:hypothetical protein